jgi:diguanylate cyclase (GGDEF)-like protein
VAARGGSGKPEGPSVIDVRRLPALSKRLTAASLTLCCAIILWRAAAAGFQGQRLTMDIGATWYLAVSVAVIVFSSAAFAVRKLARYVDAQVRYLGSLDALTGLPNRSVLMEWLERPSIAVVYLDLDRFKLINDSLGHGAGDEVLRVVSRRLRNLMRESDLIVRLGGDEFAIVIEDEAAQDAAVAAAGRILAALRVPVRLEGHDFFLAGSIGVAVKCESLRDPHDLLRAADLALYRAKRQGRDQMVVFNSSPEVMDQLDLEGDLMRALERGEIEVHYQPEVDIATGKITGFEALVRWRHPEHGLLKPARFISIAEENGALQEIGMWVLEQACRQWRRWQEMTPALGPMTISVNLSPRQLQQPDLVERIERVLEETGMEPSQLQLEIGEGVAINDGGALAVKFARLRASGVRFVVDDFGMNSSALRALKALPVQSVKIDQSFISNMEEDDANLLIVQAIVTLAHDLGLDVTAEGVETRKQLDYLHDLGCDRGQGYYLAEPLPEETILMLLETYRNQVVGPAVA